VAIHPTLRQAGWFLLAAAVSAWAQAPSPGPGPYASGRPRPRPEPPELQPKLDPGLQPYRPAATNLSGSLKGMASDILPGIAKLWIDGFRKHHPGVVIECGPPYGGRIGAAELIQGGVDFALVSRELVPTDISQFEAKFGYPPLTIAVSGGSYRHFGFLDAMGVIVSRDNPLERITFSQVDAIFSSTRHRGQPPIRKWGELGLTGDWADKEIHAYGVKPWNGFEEFVRQRVLSVPGKRGEWRSDLTFDELIFPMTTHVARDASGISYTGFAFLMTGVKVVAIAEDERGPYSSGSFADVASWRYPLARVFYIAVNRRPGRPLDPRLAEFVRFILSRDGQQLVREDALYIPLSAALAETSRRQLD
jgi:phosphate transport system substrate-binding protein